MQAIPLDSRRPRRLLQDSTSEDPRSSTQHRHRPQSPSKIQPTPHIAPTLRLRGKVIGRVQHSDRHPPYAKRRQPNLAATADLILGQQAREHGCDEQGHVLQVITVATLGALPRGVLALRQAALEVCLDTRGCWITVIVAGDVAMGRDPDGVAMWILGEHTTQTMSMKSTWRRVKGERLTSTVRL